MINVTSSSATSVPVPFFGVYAASKAALETITETMRLEELANHRLEERKVFICRLEQ